MIQLILLQAKGGDSGMGLMILMAAVFGVMYFFMIRPQQKKQKDEVKWRETLKTGDKVVTIGGLHGTVVGVEDDKVVLSVDNGVRLTFNVTAISQESTAKYYGADAKLAKK
jgi:preprotein translocase subunit YajC